MSAKEHTLTISVIIPMYNAGKFIEHCLAPLLRMRERGEVTEIIVVDDGSTDDSADMVRRREAVRLISMPHQGGPAAARNRGVQTAIGDYVWFVDSDVVVAEDAGRVLRETLASTRAAAVIGSYDDTPAAGNFLSQYKNLVHHYYHHRGKEQASTFWAGCGAVERQMFQRIGGFDARRYRFPSIEDIELGYRIGDAGGEIALNRNLQGKHFKEWRFRNLVHTEIFRRAMPWTRLMLERKNVTNDLNVGTGERVRAVLVLALIGAAGAWAAGWMNGWLLVVLAGLVVFANARFLSFFVRKRGLLFAAGAFLFHQIYYIYSSAAFAAAVIEHWFLRGTRRVRGAA